MDPREYEPPPTPWRIETDRDAHGQPATHRIDDADGHPLFVEGLVDGTADQCDSDLFPTIVRSVNAHQAMLAELEEHEWSGDKWCPSCAASRGIGHAPDCTLAATLRLAKGPPTSLPPGHPQTLPERKDAAFGAMRAVLKRREWSAEMPFEDRGCCPSCGGSDPSEPAPAEAQRGHTPDCDWAAALRLAEELA